MESTNKITFDNLPESVAQLREEMHNGFRLLLEKSNKQSQPEPDRWLSLDELCEYLPGKPARATVYGYVHRREIPHKKFGNKRLAFLRSEIDEWLKSQKRKTVNELSQEAQAHISKSKKIRN